MRYRWIDKAGEPVSPRHLSVETAVRWLGRQPMASRARVLTRAYPPNAPLSAVEKARAVSALHTVRIPSEAWPWIKRTAETVDRRRRKRAALPMMMRHLRTKGTR